jgi:hypothetical protein
MGMKIRALAWVAAALMSWSRYPTWSSGNIKEVTADADTLLSEFDKRFDSNGDRKN